MGRAAEQVLPGQVGQAGQAGQVGQAGQAGKRGKWGKRTSGASRARRKIQLFSPEAEQAEQAGQVAKITYRPRGATTLEWIPSQVARYIQHSSISLRLPPELHEPRKNKIFKVAWG